MQTLSRSEMEIMSALWASGKPLSRTEIIEASPQKTWKASSIHILLNSLLEKQMIFVDGFTKTGSHYGRTFAPAITEAQCVAMQIQRMDSFQKGQAEAVKNVVSALLDEAELGDETLLELEKLLREKRK